MPGVTSVSLMMLSELVRTRSRMLPYMCVGRLLYCNRLYSVTMSMKEWWSPDLGELGFTDIVFQLIEGRLKSPIMIFGSPLVLLFWFTVFRKSKSRV